MQFIFKMNSRGHSGILIKQLINHFQQITIISFLDLGWTPEIKEYFSIQEYFSFASEEFVSLDCLFDSLEGNLLVKRIVVSYLSPLILTWLCMIGWSLMIATRRFLKKPVPLNFLSSRNRASFIVVVYLLFPEILRKCFAFLNCIQIDENSDKSVILTSPDTVCWTQYHFKLILISVVPGVAAWGVIAPATAFFYLRKNRNKIFAKTGKITLVKEVKDSGSILFHEKIDENFKGLSASEVGYSEATKNSLKDSDSIKENNENLSYNMLNFFFKGYQPRFYYWELVMFLKKISLILFASFTEFFPGGIKATLLSIILVVFTLLQTRNNPFESERLNSLEFSSLIVTFMTANVGIMLLSDELKTIGTVLLFVMIALNIWFLQMWLVTFLRIICPRRANKNAKKVKL